MNAERTVYVGDVPIGGSHPVVIQSMINTDLKERDRSLDQITRLHESGSRIVRIAYPGSQYRDDFEYIVSRAPCPVIADIHFSADLAVEAMDMGASKIRINPGNIKRRNLKRIIDKARLCNVPIRIGVNSGSLEKDLLEKYGHPVPDGLVESALRSIAFFEENDFDNIVLSVKSSDVNFMIESNVKLARKTDYPIHLGVTEAGGLIRGTVKNSIGIGYLLKNNIGDTVRVSLSTEPEKEIEVAKKMLKALHLYGNAPDVISCPTCSRSTFDVAGMQETVEKHLENVKKDITVAVMGCVVNGPGEAKEADFGITGSLNECVLFRKGEIIFKGNPENAIKKLLEEVDRYEKD
ncbi:MAG: flavodoxin-dependent (E)-4-hydroxy-3-methylbut-2-enyl-diphosphate synthase [bacterium]